MCSGLDEARRSGLTTARVAANEEAAEGVRRLLLEVPEWRGPTPRPGQFLMLRPSSGQEPLLARPLGFADFAPSASGGARIEVLLRTVGRGTALIAGWSVGAEARFLGPLGQGFPMPPPGSRSLLLAGGIGLPPILFLARAMAREGRGAEVTLAYGEATASRSIAVASPELDGGRLLLFTEDGGLGRRGRVTHALEEPAAPPLPHLFACGPPAMLRAARALAVGRTAASHFSLEARMACGFGVCSGCAVRVRRGEGWEYVRACTEGPVLPGDWLDDASFPLEV